MKRSELDKIHNEWFNYPQKEYTLHLIQSSLCGLVLNSIQHNNDQVDKKIIPEETLLEALRCAHLIDSKKMDKLSFACKFLIKKLYPLLNAEFNDLFITNLSEANTFLESERPLASLDEKKQAKNAFEAIVHFSNLPTIPAEVISVQIKTDKDPLTYYFHGDLYLDSAARKKALENLAHSLITIWNEAAENKQLDFLIKNIKCGPCVEGATREALEKMAISLQNKVLPADFDSSIASYYSAAKAVLTCLGLEATLFNIEALIVNANEGNVFTPKQDRPNTITRQHVKSYLKSLNITDYYYYTDKNTNEASVIPKVPYLESIYNSPYAINRKLFILSAVIEYASPDLQLQLADKMYRYSALCSIINLNQILTSTQIQIYLACLKAENAFNQAIMSVYSAIILAFRHNQSTLVEALFENSEISLYHQNKYFRMADLFVIISNLNNNNIALFEQILKWNNYTLPKDLTADKCSLIFRKLCLKGRSSILIELLIHNPELFSQALYPHFCQLVQENNISVFQNLCKHSDGIEVLNLFISKNESFFKQLTWQELFMFSIPENISDREYSSSAFGDLISINEAGRALVLKFLEFNNKLVEEFTVESFRDYLSTLSCTEGGIKLLNYILKHNAKLASPIKLETLCENTSLYSPNHTILFQLNATENGKIALKELLRGKLDFSSHGSTENCTRFVGLLHFIRSLDTLKCLIECNNYELADKLSIDVLCGMPIYGKFIDNNTAFSYFASDNKFPILKILLEHNNKRLANALNADILCRPYTRGSCPGGSIFLRLTANQDSLAYLKLLLERNNHQIASQMTSLALCRPVTYNGATLSPLLRLSSSIEGIQFLKYLFTHNPQSAAEISANDLARKTYDLHSGYPKYDSAFSALVTSEDGISVLATILQTGAARNKNNIPKELLTCPLSAGPHSGKSPLDLLNNSQQGKILISQNNWEPSTTNTSLATQRLFAQPVNSRKRKAPEESQCLKPQ